MPFPAAFAFAVGHVARYAPSVKRETITENTHTII